jgi:hypothetical protein
MSASLIWQPPIAWTKPQRLPSGKQYTFHGHHWHLFQLQTTVDQQLVNWLFNLPMMQKMDQMTVKCWQVHKYRFRLLAYRTAILLPFMLFSRGIQSMFWGPLRLLVA